ncbi:hypothetical protein [Streptomyces sp. V1I1]|uniref:hypothetical protein n=1 Tax=Streptomyces sp. V1I1 TaxID=3042272 RepID=UPI0027D84769|nr:hypothetical protein [Streptomyces sp. V1I1]
MVVVVGTPGDARPVADGLPDGVRDTDGESATGAEDVAPGDSDGGADGARQDSSRSPPPPVPPQPVTRLRTSNAPTAVAFHPPVTLPMTGIIASGTYPPHRFHGSSWTCDTGTHGHP